MIEKPKIPENRKTEIEKTQTENHFYAVLERRKWVFILRLGQELEESLFDQSQNRHLTSCSRQLIPEILSRSVSKH